MSLEIYFMFVILFIMCPTHPHTGVHYHHKMVTLFVLAPRSVGVKTLAFEFDATTRVADLWSFVQDRCAVACGHDSSRAWLEHPRLRGRGPESTLIDAGLVPDDCVRVRLALLGGKGGFGANLKKMIKRLGGIKKSENQGAARDLTGRRLRHLEDEAELKEWYSQDEKTRMTPYELQQALRAINEGRDVEREAEVRPRARGKRECNYGQDCRLALTTCKFDHPWLQDSKDNVNRFGEQRAEDEIVDFNDMAAFVKAGLSSSSSSSSLSSTPSSTSSSLGSSSSSSSSSSSAPAAKRNKKAKSAAVESEEFMAGTMGYSTSHAHLLVFTLPSNAEWTCDGCNDSTHTADKHCFRSVEEDCDFDLCAACFTKTRDPSRVVAREGDLANGKSTTVATPSSSSSSSKQKKKPPVEADPFSIPWGDIADEAALVAKYDADRLKILCEHYRLKAGGNAVMRAKRLFMLKTHEKYEQIPAKFRAIPKFSF
jgi:hypothetical protein